MDIAALGYQVDSSALDTATPKLEKMTAAALKADAAADKLAKNSTAVNTGVAKTGVAAAGATAQMNKYGGASANVFAQLNDIAVMMAAGQSPMQLAMQQGMQLNQVWAQLGGNIKSIGGVIGSALMSMLNPINLVTIGVIAFGSAAVNWFMASGDEAKKTKTAMEQLSEAVDNYVSSSQAARVPTSELKDEFGRMAFAARDALSAIADAEKKIAIDNLGISIKQLASSALTLEVAMGSGGKGLEAAIFNMGLARQEAIDLKAAFVELTTANTLEDQAEAAISLASELDIARNAAGELPAPLQAAYDETQRIIVEAARLSGEIEKTNVSIWDFVQATVAGKGGIQGMSSEAVALTGFLGAAANKAWELAYAAGQARIAALAAANAIQGMDNPDPNAQGMTDRELRQTEFLTGLVESRVEAENTAKALKEMGKSGGGAGKKLTEAQKKAKKALEDTQKAAEKLQEELDAPMLGAIDGVSNAWGDFVAGGFKDFKGFVDSVKDSFKSMISEMIAYSVKNKIMLAMGFSTTASAAGVAQAATGSGGGGGILSTLLSGGGTASGGGLSGIIGGVSGGFSGVLNGFLSGGLGGAGKALTTALSGATSGMAGLATAAGALGAVAIGVGAVLSFFKTKTKLLNAGMKITVGNMGALVESFQTVEKSKFWGLSKKTSTEYDVIADTLTMKNKALAQSAKRGLEKVGKVYGTYLAEYLQDRAFGKFSLKKANDRLLGKVNGEWGIEGLAKIMTAKAGSAKKTFTNAAESVFGASEKVAKKEGEKVRANKNADNPIILAIEKIQKSVQKSAELIGVSGKAFEKFRQTIWFDTKDLTQEQIQERLTQRLTKMGNSYAKMIPGLMSMHQAGENAMQTLSRIGVQLQAVNKTWRVLGFDLFDVSIKGAKATDAIVKLFGGVEKFLQSTAFYFENFYTDAEKIKQLRKQLNAGFDRAGVGGKLPKSIEDYRALVDKLEAQGRDKAAALLIKLAPLFVELENSLNGVADGANALKNALDPNDFATLFDFQKANGMWMNGVLKNEPNGPSIYSAPASSVAASTSPAVSQSNGNSQSNSNSSAGAENNDALLSQILQKLTKLTNINNKWDVDGLPAERT